MAACSVHRDGAAPGEASGSFSRFKRVFPTEPGRIAPRGDASRQVSAAGEKSLVGHVCFGFLTGNPAYLNSRDTHKSPTKAKMILTTCPACAAPLAHDAPRCVRCWTRYSTQDRVTLIAALNYAISLVCLKRFEEAKSLLRKVMPVARRVLGDTHDHTLRMREIYARALYYDPDATLDDLHEAVATLEDTERIAHPITKGIENELRDARAALRARENAATVDPD